MRTFHFVILLLGVCTNILFAQTGDAFTKANTAFEKEDYQNAISNYESILSKGEESLELYYNLANSYYKSDKLGKAILNYERALVLSPDDENTLFNLQLARRKVKGEIDPVEPFFLRAWWNTTRDLLGPNVWGGIALLLFWGGIAGLSLWQLGKDRPQKKKGFLIGVSLLLLTLIPFALAWSSHQYQQNTNRAVLISTSSELKTGADEQSKSLRIIYEGTRLELLDQINIWHKVRLQNGETGWVTKASFEEI
ncbi:MAG: tetratricopeptide repeat protein [Saprospiraceae bacterium]